MNLFAQKHSAPEAAEPLSGAHFLNQEHLGRLNRSHRRGASVRVGASLFIFVFAYLSYLAGGVTLTAIWGVAASGIFIVAFTTPLLWVLSRTRTRGLYEMVSILVNLLEVIGYTAVIYFLGGIRAGYLSPIYAAVITYVGVVAPRRFPFILAGICASAFAAMVAMEHAGLLPHQNMSSSYDLNWPQIILILILFTASLFIVAFISSFTADQLRRHRNQLHLQNRQLVFTNDKLNQEIRERRQVEAGMAHLAFHDPLTGLPNRKSFYIRLQEQIDQSLRSGQQPLWAICFLDLDRFKTINDSLGHDAGDVLLKNVARRLTECLRRTDLVFRLGGDEFIILLRHLQEKIHVTQVAQKIITEISRPVSIKGHEFIVTASMGISIYAEHGHSVEQMVKNADVAMYAAKQQGNRFQYFTPEMNQRIFERLTLENQMRQALESGQFLLHFQPIVDQDNRIVGAEALLRWQHPEMGLIGPDQFITVAEETQQIIPIGQWVLESACKQAMKWHARGYPNLFVAVNLSVRQFCQPDLISFIEKALSDSRLPPTLLCLEVTENGIIRNIEDAAAKVKWLRAKGIRFSIDDFGTGYSFLSHLKRFPIDSLKIDRSFVIDAPANREDREIIKAILAIAKSLNIATVAEGVETIEQARFLAEAGSSMMQGFFFGHPMTLDALMQHMDAQRPGMDASTSESRERQASAKSSG